MNNRPAERAIRELAYRLWEARGRRQGHAIEDWLDAERQIRSQRPDPVAEATRERPRKRAKPVPPAKAPTVPIDDAVPAQDETPKIGSRDAPGG
jgi:hypothetical protein